MQDQGKRLLIAVGLGLGLLLLWNMFAHKDEPSPDQTAGSSASGASGGAVASPASGQAVGHVPHIGPVEAEKPAGGAAPAPVAQTIVLPFDRFVATFNSACGGLVSWRLLDPRYHRDATKGELLPAPSNMTVTDAQGKTVPVPAAELAGLPACGTFDVNFVTATSSSFPPVHAAWQGEKVSPTEVRYTLRSDQLDIVKDFTVVPQSYAVRMTTRVTVHVAEGASINQQLAVSVYAFQDPAELKNGSSRIAPRAWSSATLRDDTSITTDVTGVIEWPRFEPVFRWTGFEHPYLLAGYAPQQGDRVEKHTSGADGTKGLPRGFMRTDLVYPMTALKHGDAPLVKTVIAYLGPKNYDDLQGADGVAGFATGFNKVIDFGWFAFIGRPLLWLLQKFQEVVGNWGIAIIMLTILVKVLTLYWTTKSMRSMKQMAALAPQMKALQAKYADDKQRQQAETMALYKQHGVNPVAGCLPIVLQMPIWIALYRMLSSAGELYLQPFIPGWIGDLTNTDPYYVLPAVLFISMFVQARLQPASADSTQQKFLQYGMPIMFGVMAFIFPAGLTLYMLTNNLLSMLHSIYMNKFDKQSLALAAQLKKNQEAVAAAAAKEAKSAGATTGAASAPGNQGNQKKNGKSAAKRVIDAKATEVVAGERADEDRASDGEDAAGAAEAADAAATPGAAAARNRPRRKKRRR